MAKLRKMGDILLDLEPLFDELADHELQLGDILSLVKSYYEIHQPEVIEKYEDGGKPEYYYGPAKKKRKRNR